MVCQSIVPIFFFDLCLLRRCLQSLSLFTMQPLTLLLALVPAVIAAPLTLEARAPPNVI